jgi:hypothetical protein
MSTQPTDSARKVSSNRLNRQVAQYSLAATMAGVSMLALVQPVAGEVVVTKKTIPIPLSTDGLSISMANNGIDEFRFQFFMSDVYRELVASALSPNSQLITGGGFGVYAQALPRGAKIGSSNSFFSGGGLVEASHDTYANNRIFKGNWGGNPKNQYVGVRFQMNGQTHYGWIRLTLTTHSGAHQPFMSATITGYAYETVANKAIETGTAATASAGVQVPETIKNQVGPSLGMLAAGYRGLNSVAAGRTFGSSVKPRHNEIDNN